MFWSHCILQATLYALKKGEDFFLSGSAFWWTWTERCIISKWSLDSSSVHFWKRLVKQVWYWTDWTDWTDWTNWTDWNYLTNILVDVNRTLHYFKMVDRQFISSLLKTFRETSLILDRLDKLDPIGIIELIGTITQNYWFLKGR